MNKVAIFITHTHEEFLPESNEVLREIWRGEGMHEVLHPPAYFQSLEFFVLQVRVIGYGNSSLLNLDTKY